MLDSDVLSPQLVKTYDFCLRRRQRVVESFSGGLRPHRERMLRDGLELHPDPAQWVVVQDDLPCP